MFKRLDKMKMKQKMVFGYAVVIGMMAVVAIVGITGLFFLDQKLNSYIDGAQAADTAVKECWIEVNGAARNIREMALSKDSRGYGAYAEEIHTSMANLQESLLELKQTEILEDALYQEYEEAVTEWMETGNEIVQHLQAGEETEVLDMIFEQCVPKLQNVIGIAEKIDRITDTMKRSAQNISLNTVIFDGVVIVFILVLAVILAVKIGKQIINSITEPLGEIKEVALKLTEGDLHSHLDYHSEDEVGILAHSLRKSIRILGEYVDDIGRAMGEFAAGNFDVQPEVEWKGDFITILDSFMYFERKMADTVKNLQGVADQVSKGAQHVSGSSMDLAQGATEQAGITEQLTNTISNVARQIKQNAEQAREVSTGVEAVGTDIINSNGKMQEMVESMNEIYESSRKISQIISAIDEIASQTNLLSLNASIEAARAGEAGKGFAVVADQVSLLAAESAKAARESSDLIKTSVQAVENGMVIAEETASQLERAVAGSKEITVKVNQIAELSKQQSEVIMEVNRGVDQINGVVQSNSATSEECAAASQELTSQAEILEGLIRQFRVGSF